MLVITVYVTDIYAPEAWSQSESMPSEGFPTVPA